MKSNLLKLTICVATLNFGIFIHPAFASRSPANVYKTDNRKVIKQWTEQVSPLGQLYTKGERGCSATLIGPALVLTNAHCVLTPTKEKKVYSPKDVMFYSQATYRKASLRARAVKIHVAPDWLSHRGEGTSSFLSISDWALIELDRPIGDKVGYYDLINITRELSLDYLYGPSGEEKIFPVYMAGYSQDRQDAYVPMIQSCSIYSVIYYPIMSFTPKAMGFMHDCSGVNGSSGSPIIFRNPETGRWTVVAVHSFGSYLKKNVNFGDCKSYGGACAFSSSSGVYNFYELAREILRSQGVD